MIFRRRRIKKTSKLLYEWPVPIVADAAIATTVRGDGRLIPLLILDTTNRPDVEEYIRIHQYVGPGDVVSQWGMLEDSSGRVALHLSFKGPMELSVLLAFDPGKQGSLVDQIIHSKGLYLQAGKPGDRYVKNPDAPKVIASIPDTGISEAWNDIFFRATVKQLRDRGLPRNQAKQAARSFIADWRKFGSYRLGQHAPKKGVAEP